MQNKFLIFSIIPLMVIASACGDYPCSKAELQFGLIGFSDAASDTIIIRRFDKNGSRLVDTFLIANIVFERNQDTLNMKIFPGTAILQNDYNYEIVLPGATALFKVTDIREEQRYIKPRGKVGCQNNITRITAEGRVTSDIVPFDIIYFTK